MSEKRYTVWYSLPAKTDLKAIYRYIAVNLKARATAKGQTDRIRKEIKDLTLFPEKFPAVDWEPWSSKNVRKMPVDNFIVYYRVTHGDQSVEVVRIFYGGRDIENIVKDGETVANKD